jgi:hypothetical protein
VDRSVSPAAPLVGYTCSLLPSCVPGPGSPLRATCVQPGKYCSPCGVLGLSVFVV